MTVSELQIKRDEVVKSLGLIKTQFGDRSLQYGEQKTALEILDKEIADATALAAGGTRPSRFSLAGFNRG